MVVALEIEKGEGNSDDVIDLTVCLISGHQPMENLVRHNLYSHVCVDKTSPVWCEVVVVSLRGEIGWHGMV